MHQDIERVLVSEEEIITRCEQLGQEINSAYQGKCPIFVGLLKGCVPFLAELIKHIDVPMEFDFMDIDSYFGGTASTGTIQILKDLSADIQNRHVLVVDDIIDTGFTLQYVLDLLQKRGAASVEVVTLLDKPEGRKVAGVTPKYIGYNIENQFVVGFGLDYQQLYRNLPYIGILKESVYSK